MKTMKTMTDELLDKALASAKSEGWMSTPAFKAFARWRTWCRQNDVKPLPVLPGDLTRCLLDHAADGAQISTIRNLCEGTCYAHAKAGLSRSALIEDMAWRSFEMAMNSSAKGSAVVAASTADIARRAIERQERMDGRRSATG